MKKKTIGIIGFGRFGQVLFDLFQDEFRVLVSSSRYETGDLDGVAFRRFETVVEVADALFLATPINKIGSIADRLRPLLKEGQLIVDVCSIKEYSSATLKKKLAGTGVHIWPTHPMFGPDSTLHGFEGLRWVSCTDDLDNSLIEDYLDHIKKRGITVVEMSCAEHDRLAAKTQGLTHLIGRVLVEFGAEHTPIDTAGFHRLMQVKEQTCHDSWELFCDLQHFNRYSLENEKKLREAISKVVSAFLDSTITRNEVVIGIQGDRGSFSDEAIECFQKKGGTTITSLTANKTIRIEYLITAEAVLSALPTGEIDYGLVTLEASGTGPYIPCLKAMGRHPFEVVEVFDIPLVQCLLRHRDMPEHQITQVLSHPLALAQCRRTLKREFPGLRQLKGGDENDTALTAKQLSEGIIERETAVIASKTAAELYGLAVVREGINDHPENKTSFAFITRR